MKNLLISLLILLSAILSANEKIIVGGDYNYPPYSFIDENGNEAGYDVDVIKAIANTLNIEVEFRFTKWQETLNNLSEGKIDIIASIVYSNERENIYDFTFPLHSEYYAIFTHHHTNISDINDLESKIPAYLEGDISNEIFLKPMNLLHDSLPVNSLPDAFTKIQEGKCDYVIAPYPLGMETINKLHLKNIESKGPSVAQSVFCLAVKEGNDELLAKLNIGIQELSRNGKLDLIHKKWVKYRHKEEQYETKLKYSLVLLAGFSLIIIVLLIVWYSLRVRVLNKVHQIKYTEELYQKVFNSVDDILIILDRSGRIVDANTSALRMYNTTHDQFVGKFYIDVISEENKDLFQGLVDSYVTSDFDYTDEIVKEVNGEKFWFKVRGVRLKFDNEERYMGVLHNVSDEKRSIIKLEEAQKLAVEANNTKNTFLATISHEIRTPLNAIIGYSEILDKTPLNEKQQSHNSRIKVSSEILLNLVNNILDITKIDAKKLIINKMPLSVEKIVSAICDVQKLKANEQNLDLYLNYDKNIPELLLGDELRITQVLLNIINNAIKFTHKGYVSIDVTAKNIESASNNDNRINIVFTIKDTGNGISKNNISKLFKPFEQLQRADDRNYGGTGLGLAISKQLIDLMQGSIAVESSPGEGSTFTITVPFNKFEESENNVESHTNYEINYSRIKELSILMVEDNSFNADVLIELMHGINNNITHVESGDKAIEAVRNNVFDIILMDIEMPGMDGFETTKHIKQLRNGKDVPVLALSANSLDSDRKKALEAGMKNYLSKPVNVSMLTQEISLIINNDQSESLFPESDIYTQGLNFFDGNKKMYDNALASFSGNYNTAPQQLIELYNTDNENLKNLTHNLKSALKMIGASSLSNKVMEINDTLRSGRNTVNEELITDTSADLYTLLKDINSYV